MTTNTNKPAAIQIAVATILPLIVGIFATRATLLFGERYGMDAVPLVLVGWCAVLLASAAWLNRLLFHAVRTFGPFVFGIVAVLVVWLWQRLAFTRLVPRSGLVYGFFLRPEGTVARFWVLTCPFWVGLTCLSICFIGALISGWRAGGRYSLTAIIPWWVATLLIFALPSMYLHAQGNAAVFI
jgi:hypothetical protein